MIKYSLVNRCNLQLWSYSFCCYLWSCEKCFFFTVSPKICEVLMISGSNLYWRWIKSFWGCPQQSILILYNDFGTWYFCWRTLFLIGCATFHGAQEGVWESIEVKIEKRHWLLRPLAPSDPLGPGLCKGRIFGISVGEFSS